MKKTFTATLALSALASLALATSIDTPAAGYIEMTGSSSAQLVSNPFWSFTNDVMTLGDIDGSLLDSGDAIKVINSNGKVLFAAGWYDGAWYDFSDNNHVASSNSFPLARGTSIQFVSDNGKSLVFSGVLTNVDATVTYTAKGNVFAGNVSPVAKTLASLSFSNFRPDYDFVDVGGEKYVYVPKKGKWYKRSDYQNATSYSGLTDYSSTSIAAGQGVRIYCGRASANDLTATFPGSY